LYFRDSCDKNVSTDPFGSAEHTLGTKRLIYVDLYTVIRHKPRINLHKQLHYFYIILAPGNTVYSRECRGSVPDIAEGSECVFCHDVTHGTPERVEAIQLPFRLLTSKFGLAVGFDEGLGSCHAKWVRERVPCYFVSA